MQIKLKSPISPEVYYDLNSLGIAIVDPSALSQVQDHLKKTIQSPLLVIEVNSSRHLYFFSFKGTSLVFLIATLIFNENKWYVESFIFDGTLEIAQAKFKEGPIIYTKEN